MTLKDLGKVCLFSGMSGTIEMNGKPLANVRLVRKAESSTDEITTDENGHFEFPPLFRRTFAKYLPQEFVASQQITAYHEGNEYVIWSGVKREPEENAESRGKPLVVRCELTLEEKNLVIVDGSPIFSRCAWDVEPDPQEDIF
ncbi:carboxypeptidase regulatory-like domain-containing protein [Proteobacteria bacterium 005FR1]|nr:carboxypeptidase regulatory-like domain-containing protein [Proteobacteria bacterium 005FR1]